jgi:plastocyanin
MVAMWGLRARRAGALVAGLALLAGCSGGSPTSPVELPPSNTSVIVSIHNIAFNPPDLTVRAGQTVTWEFDDGTIAHDVSGAGFSSPIQTTGYFAHTFTIPGTYTYRCTIHTNMTARVVVTS